MENTDTQNNNLKEQILKKIEEGEVRMYSKGYFVFKVALLCFVIFFTFIISVVLISYTLFTFNAGGRVFLLGFGTRGFYEFILLFPWILLLIDVFLLLFLDFLLKRFRFGYNRPIVYLFVGTLVVITFSSSLVNLTPLHKNMMYRAEGNHLPMMGSFYEDLRRSDKDNGVFRGQVISIENNAFTIKYYERNNVENIGFVRVIIPLNTDIRKLVDIGDYVFVAGNLENNEITAYGIHKLGSDE